MAQGLKFIHHLLCFGVNLLLVRFGKDGCQNKSGRTMPAREPDFESGYATPETESHNVSYKNLYYLHHFGENMNTFSDPVFAGRSRFVSGLEPGDLNISRIQL